MARIEPPLRETMTAEQHRLYDKILAQRSRRTLGGPFGALLHAPETCEPVADFVNHFLSDTRVPHNLKELAILSIARKYTAQYEWFVHEPRARQAGVDDSVIEAIRHRRRPGFAKPEEALVHDIVNQIVDERALSDDLYARAIETLGEPAVVELITMIGFYHAISIVLVAFQIDIPEGGTLPFVD